jgi:hypothetical protein
LKFALCPLRDDAPEPSRLAICATTNRESHSADRGQAKEGISLLIDGLAIYRGTGARLALPFVLTTFAETYARAELPEEGLDRLAEAASVIEMTQERWAATILPAEGGWMPRGSGQSLFSDRCVLLL